PPAEPAAFARLSAVGAVAERSGPEPADFAVSGFSQPVAVAQTGAAAAPVPAVVVVFAQPSIGSAVEPVAAVVVCVPVFVVVVRRFSAHSPRRLFQPAMRRQERKRLPIS